MQVKICGTTSAFDARLALEAGADYIGVIVHHPPSPRNTSLEIAQVIKHVVGSKLVLLTVNQSPKTLQSLASSLKPYALQLHGDETPELVEQVAQQGVRVWKAIHGDTSELMKQAQLYTEAGADAVLVDARETDGNNTVYGGTGQVADWDGAHALVEAGYRVILAGGLSPQNLGRAIQHVHPLGVDCVSGVESRKGVKDKNLVRDFVREARKAARQKTI